MIVTFRIAAWSRRATRSSRATIPGVSTHLHLTVACVAYLLLPIAQSRRRGRRAAAASNLHVAQRRSVRRLCVPSWSAQLVEWRYDSEFRLTDDWLRKLTDRKSTRLNSSHLVISYAVSCLQKKNGCRIACHTPTTCCNRGSTDSSRHIR